MSRILFPETGFTTDDAVEYYESIARFLLPHLKNVPVSLLRYPGTVHGDSFWEKNAPSFTPDWVKTAAVPRRSGGPDIHYIVINDLRTLRWVAGVGGIELHTFLHRWPRIERATAVVFDLDPGPGASIVECCRVALLLREALDAIKLKAFSKVSGSKGLQVYVPLNGTETHESTELFARLIADELARAYPRLIVSKMAKHLRAKKVFIDWSQNADYKTTVAVYSLRAKRPAPFVSMPVTWEEVERAEDLEFTPGDAVKRKSDLFAPMLKLKQKLPSFGVRRQSRRFQSGSSSAAAQKKTQSGRRLFVLLEDELWIETRGRFKRWILRPDREGGPQLIAMPAGEWPIPKDWRDKVKIEEEGTYELMQSSDRRLDLFFNGRKLNGEWILEKAGDESHRSWRLHPA